MPKCKIYLKCFHSPTILDVTLMQAMLVRRVVADFDVKASTRAIGTHDVGEGTWPIGVRGTSEI